MALSCLPEVACLLHTAIAGMRRPTSSWMAWSSSKSTRRPSPPVSGAFVLVPSGQAHLREYDQRARPPAGSTQSGAGWVLCRPGGALVGPRPAGPGRRTGADEAPRHGTSLRPGRQRGRSQTGWHGHFPGPARRTSDSTCALSSSRSRARSRRRARRRATSSRRASTSAGGRRGAIARLRLRRTRSSSATGGDCRTPVRCRLTGSRRPSRTEAGGRIRWEGSR